MANKKQIFDENLSKTELHIVIDSDSDNNVKLIMNGDRISLCHAVAAIMRQNSQFSDVIKASVEINREMEKEKKS